MQKFTTVLNDVIEIDDRGGFVRRSDTGKLVQVTPYTYREDYKVKVTEVMTRIAVLSERIEEVAKIVRLMSDQTGGVGFWPNDILAIKDTLHFEKKLGKEFTGVNNYRSKWRRVPGSINLTTGKVNFEYPTCSDDAMILANYGRDKSEFLLKLGKVDANTGLREAKLLVGAGNSYKIGYSTTIRKYQTRFHLEYLSKMVSDARTASDFDTNKRLTVTPNGFAVMVEKDTVTLSREEESGVVSGQTKTLMKWPFGFWESFADRANTDPMSEHVIGLFINEGIVQDLSSKRHFLMPVARRNFWCQPIKIDVDTGEVDLFSSRDSNPVLVHPRHTLLRIKSVENDAGFGPWEMYLKTPEGDRSLGWCTGGTFNHADLEVGDLIESLNIDPNTMSLNDRYLEPRIKLSGPYEGEIIASVRADDNNQPYLWLNVQCNGQRRYVNMGSDGQKVLSILQDRTYRAQFLNDLLHQKAA